MPRYGSSRDGIDCKVYVGDLPRDASEKELERAFSYYGPLKNVWVARNPPGFAFVEFEDPRDADDAVRSMDGTSICGVRARVEHSSGKVRPKPWLRRGPSQRSGGGGGGGRDRGRGFDPNDRCYQCGERGHYAYDCRGSRSGGGSRRRSRSYSRSRSRSYDRRRSYTRSRSRSRYSRNRSYSREHDKNSSPSKGRSMSRERGKQTRSRSRSQSAKD